MFISIVAIVRGSCWNTVSGAVLLSLRHRFVFMSLFPLNMMMMMMIVMCVRHWTITGGRADMLNVVNNVAHLAEWATVAGRIRTLSFPHREPRYCRRPPCLRRMRLASVARWRVSAYKSRLYTFRLLAATISAINKITPAFLGDRPCSRKSIKVIVLV